MICGVQVACWSWPAERLQASLPRTSEPRRPWQSRAHCAIQRSVHLVTLIADISGECDPRAGCDYRFGLTAREARALRIQLECWNAQDNAADTRLHQWHIQRILAQGPINPSGSLAWAAKRLFSGVNQGWKRHNFCAAAAFPVVNSRILHR